MCVLKQGSEHVVASQNGHVYREEGAWHTAHGDSSARGMIFATVAGGDRSLGQEIFCVKRVS